MKGGIRVVGCLPEALLAVFFGPLEVEPEFKRVIIRDGRRDALCGAILVSAYLLLADVDDERFPKGCSGRLVSIKSSLHLLFEFFIRDLLGSL